MNKIFLFFLPVIICGKIFAQHEIVIFSNEKKESDTVRTGAYVKLSLANGKKKSGYISKIESDFFIVNSDTIFPGMIYKFACEPEAMDKFGKNTMIAGASLVAVGAGLLLLSVHTRHIDPLGLVISGITFGSVGVIVFAVGAGVDVGECSVRKRIGSDWHVKIV